jgi:hypothetical protein
VRVIAVGPDPVAHPVQEARQAVSLPFVEVVRGVGRSGSATLVSYHAKVVDEVGMEVPALGDEAVNTPGVLGVDPVHHLIEPLPHLATQLPVAARGWVPRAGKVIYDSNGLSLFVIPYGSGEPKVYICDPHPLTDAGKVANPGPLGRPISLGAVHLSVPSVHGRPRAAIEPLGISNVH